MRCLTLNYLKRITLFDPTYMMSMADLMVIGVETSKIDSECSLEKESTELILINPWMVLCQTINGVDSCHDCVRSPLTRYTKDILWMNDHVLIMTYESLDTGSLKHYRLDTTWSPRTWLSGQDGFIRPPYKRRSTQGIRCS